MDSEEVCYYECCAFYKHHFSKFSEIKFFVKDVLYFLCSHSDFFKFWGHGIENKKFKVFNVEDLQFDDSFEECARFLSEIFSKEKLQPEAESNNWKFNFYHSTEAGVSCGNVSRSSELPYVTLDITSEHDYSAVAAHSKPGKNLLIKLRIEKKYIGILGGAKILVDFFQKISNFDFSLDFAYVFDSSFQSLSNVHSSPLDVRKYVDCHKVHPAWCWLYKTYRFEVISSFPNALPVYWFEKNARFLSFQLTENMTDSVSVEDIEAANKICQVYFGMYFGDDVVRALRVLPWDKGEASPAQNIVVRCAIFDDYDESRNVYITKRRKRKKHVLSIKSIKKASSNRVPLTEEDLIAKARDSLEARFARHQLQTLESLKLNSATLEWHIGWKGNYDKLIQIFEYAQIDDKKIRILYDPDLMND